MRNVLLRSLLLLGLALPVSAVHEVSPASARISDIVPTTPDEIEEHCGHFVNNGCGVDPLCDDFCPPDLDLGGGPADDPFDDPPPPPPSEICNNSLDDDGNGQTDCRDTACIFAPACPEFCTDGIDNDSDGTIDCRDARCQVASECTEFCDDGIDNDHDGRTDCADASCTFSSDCPRGGPLLPEWR